MKNRIIRLIGIMAAAGMAAGPACSIVTAADETVPAAAELSYVYEVNGLGGAAAAFEEGLFDDEKPLLGKAGAMSCLDDELELFDVWAGGELTVFSNEEEKAAAEVSTDTETEDFIRDDEAAEEILAVSVQPVAEAAQQAAEVQQPSAEEFSVEEELPAVQQEAPAEAAEEQAAEEMPEEENAAAVTENTGDLGAQLAAYACQFVGNPYVYGGVSLTQGADCSGFVMSVYAQFGVSLPHSSSADRSAGYAVDGLTQAIPGDIICYNGHVAIYIGNGEIVHAFNSRKGITITNADYDTIIAVRRIF